MPIPERPTSSPADPLETDDEESPAAPAIPSLASLRASRDRSAIDVLVPGGPPVPSVPAAVPRPAEYADLLRFGVRVVRVMAGVPLRAAEWAVREPVLCLRRFLGR